MNFFFIYIIKYIIFNYFFSLIFQIFSKKISIILKIEKKEKKSLSWNLNSKFFQNKIMKNDYNTIIMISINSYISHNSSILIIILMKIDELYRNSMKIDIS